MRNRPCPILIRASGFCMACDSRFTDELVLRYPDRALPCGYADFEVRHLHDAQPPQKRAIPPAGQQAKDRLT
ncbi:MAG: hypothetical protein JWM93_2095 [Frankiales bacterium]|nr:hypothetical protein [Frankiales bacterium]